mmetsp:Transcript_25083/g.36848  ORF Transcript_25083/g.36848 Transcript_25083/m.36848 type:complete len:527 (-) Transcript_25083:6-1586(-)
MAPPTPENTSDTVAANGGTNDEKNPTDVDEEKALELKNEGNEAVKQSHFADAARLYSQGLSFSPNNTVLLCNRAMAYIKLESYGLAIADATAAIAIDKTCAKAYYRRGSAEFALGKPKAARKDFRMVCKLKPRDKDARAKFNACEKAVKQILFAAAIESEETAPLCETINPGAFSIDSSYDGPHPAGGSAALSSDDEDKERDFFEAGALPMEFVMAAIERFKDQKLIHKRYVARLLVSCKHYFETQSSLMELSIPDAGPDPDTPARITVCGDTHGQFYDVLHIFEMNGYPSSTNPYLFNGDFVDRGSFSVEVILTYLLLKIACPDCIHLTRGNHETKNMNKIYGFEGEVKHKYDEQIFDLFLEVFCELPLAGVIGGKIFVTHGGLPTEPNVSLDDIRKIKRGSEPGDSGLMSDLLWSDPQPQPGKSPSKRGVGFSFGPDITEAFLKYNDLDLLVRSHEVRDEGYLVEQGGKTITIFSAPNYCDSMANKGAYIHFDASLKPKFTKFNAVPHPEVKPMAYASGMGGMF